MIDLKSRYIISFIVFMTLVSLLLINPVQGVGWKTTIIIEIPAHGKYGSSSNCSAGNELEINYLVTTGQGVNAYLLYGENRSNFLMGEAFTYIVFDQNSVSGNWTYTTPSDGYYGIYYSNDNDVAITIWFEFIRKEPLGAPEISFGFYFLIPVVVGIISLVIIMMRRKLRWN